MFQIVIQAFQWMNLRIWNLIPELKQLLPEYTTSLLIGPYAPPACTSNVTRQRLSLPMLTECSRHITRRGSVQLVGPLSKLLRLSVTQIDSLC